MPHIASARSSQQADISSLREDLKPRTLCKHLDRLARDQPGRFQKILRKQGSKKPVQYKISPPRQILALEPRNTVAGTSTLQNLRTQWSPLQFIAQPPLATAPANTTAAAAPTLATPVPASLTPAPAEDNADAAAEAIVPQTSESVSRKRRGRGVKGGVQKRQKQVQELATTTQEAQAHAQAVNAPSAAPVSRSGRAINRPPRLRNIDTLCVLVVGFAVGFPNAPNGGPRSRFLWPGVVCVGQEGGTRPKGEKGQRTPSATGQYSFPQTITTKPWL